MHGSGGRTLFAYHWIISSKVSADWFDVWRQHAIPPVCQPSRALSPPHTGVCNQPSTNGRIELLFAGPICRKWNHIRCGALTIHSVASVAFVSGALTTHTQCGEGVTYESGCFVALSCVCVLACVPKEWMDCRVNTLFIVDRNCAQGVCNVPFIRRWLSECECAERGANPGRHVMTATTYYWDDWG